MAFPTYSDSVDIAQLQAAVEAAIAAHTKSGYVNGTIAAGQSYVDLPVVYSTPFAVSPAIGLGVRVVSTSGYTASIVAKSLSGFTIRVYRPAGASTSAAANVSVDWTANDLLNS